MASDHTPPESGLSWFLVSAFGSVAGGWLTEQWVAVGLLLSWWAGVRVCTRRYRWHE